MDHKALIDHVLANAEALRKGGVLHLKIGDAEFWLEPDDSAQLAYLEQLRRGAENGKPEHRGDTGERNMMDGSSGFARRPTKDNEE